MDGSLITTSDKNFHLGSKNILWNEILSNNTRDHFDQFLCQRFFMDDLFIYVLLLDCRLFYELSAPWSPLIVKNTAGPIIKVILCVFNDFVNN